MNDFDAQRVHRAVHEHEHKYHREVTSWRRIDESTPPEGIAVLLWNLAWDESNHVIVGIREGDEYTRVMATGMYEWIPTHWMHIPL